MRTGGGSSWQYRAAGYDEPEIRRRHEGQICCLMTCPKCLRSDRVLRHDGGSVTKALNPAPEMIP
jgi:hypothetical protein